MAPNSRSPVEAQLLATTVLSSAGSYADAQHLMSSNAPSTYKAAVLSDSPLAYYRFDERSGAALADSSGNARTGTLSGTVAYGVTGAIASDPDTALGFNGVNSQGLAPNLPALAKSYSAEAWFATSQLAEQHIMSLYPQEVWVASGRVLFGTATSNAVSASAGYANGRYHHVVATYDGVARRLYVDGTLVGAQITSGGAVSGRYGRIGMSYLGGRVFSGSLDEVAIYTHMLDVSRVVAHYAAAAAGSGISTKRVMTADYVAGDRGTSVAPAALGPWLDWAETSFQANPAVRAAGIKAMYYTDPNRAKAGDTMYTSDETTFAHTCSGNRILTTTYGVYLMNPAATSLRRLWQNYIVSRGVGGVRWDAIFEDDANDVIGVPTMPCGYSAGSWLSASQGMNTFQLPVPIIYSGLQISNEMGLNVSSNVLGGMEEGCYSSSPSIPKLMVPYWTQVENTEIGMAQQNKLFFCYGRDTSNASSAIDGRLYTYASFLLTYTPSLSVLWEYYATPSGFHVEPESQIVALNPLVAQPGDVGDLQTSSGLYAREYATCYLAGVLVGPCAAVVNPDRFNAHAYPFGTKYLHTLSLSGGGVLDGGRLSLLGAAPRSTLPALGSLIAFR